MNLQRIEVHHLLPRISRISFEGNADEVVRAITSVFTGIQRTFLADWAANKPGWMNHLFTCESSGNLFQRGGDNTEIISYHPDPDLSSLCMLTHTSRRTVSLSRYPSDGGVIVCDVDFGPLGSVHAALQLLQSVDRGKAHDFRIMESYADAIAALRIDLKLKEIQRPLINPPLPTDLRELQPETIPDEWASIPVLDPTYAELLMAETIPDEHAA